MTIDGVDGGNGADGLSIVWHGEAVEPDPAWEILNHCYRDTDNGYVYIYNGATWELMVLDGSDGATGATGDSGWNVYITYNDNAIDDTPDTPTGNGTTGGWHTTPTAACNWMSQKVAADASSGTWGTPIIITGANAIVGSVASDNGLAWVQAVGPGAWSPVGTTTTLTVTFYQGGAVLKTRTVVITRSDATLTAPTPDTVNGITYSRIGNGTSVITIEFEHVASGIKIAETVYAIEGAVDAFTSSVSAYTAALSSNEAWQEVTITTHGDPVLIIGVASAYLYGQARKEFYMKRDTTTIFSGRVSVYFGEFYDRHTVPAMKVDTPEAGTYTYYFLGESGLKADNRSLVAVELRT